MQVRSADALLGNPAGMTSPAFPARKRGRRSHFSIAETSSLD